ncbi:MAG: lytic transglycosylase domain-containing protein [Burkholderiales bacterium]|nr:lytic transglycosylase domain-containing protein [Burkholderiales bacterium]MDE2396406.1 lytic transglycosylase domain-containing protein [Burkholderiales bacterium]MDE2452976.1 lytic transglycosylase domain-containing protein [Burkholderiales bacterium]
MACAGAQGASLWGFVDGEGTAHFAARERDSRYRLVLGDGVSDPNTRVFGKADDAGAMLTWLEIAPEVRSVSPLLRDAARRHGIDAELLTALIAVESGFNAQAVSPRGAVGLMQITAETADRYATDAERRVPALQRLRDAPTNIATGARMLADLIRRFGRIDLALAAWNAGEGNVRRYHGLPPIDETHAHVRMVLELYWALLQNSQARHALRMTLQ